MKTQRFTYTYTSKIPDFWLEVAKKVCNNMHELDLDDELVTQDRQIWSEVERVCSQFGFDVHYWPENLMIVPVDSGKIPESGRERKSIS